MSECTVHGGLWRGRPRTRSPVRAHSPKNVSRRVAKASANRLSTLSPLATRHNMITSVTHMLSHMDPRGGDSTGATSGDAASPHAAAPASTVRMSIAAAPELAAGEAADAPVVEPSAVPAMSGIGLADAETTRPMQAKVNAQAAATHSPRCDRRATAPAMDVDTHER